MIDPVLGATLTRVAGLLADARGPWWVIGSAAVALHGAPVAVTRDVDVLVDAADMPLLAERTGGAAAPGEADERFRSDHVLRLSDGPLAVEFFAGFHFADEANGWRELHPITRDAVPVGAATLFVPAKDELIAILTQFGRPKDLARAAL